MIIENERILNMHDRYVNFHYVCIPITKEEFTLVEQLKRNKEKGDVLIGEKKINIAAIEIAGDTETIPDNLVSPFISKAQVDKGWWSNIEEYFMQGKFEDQDIKYLSQKTLTASQIFKLHLEKMGNPEYCLVYRTTKTLDELNVVHVKQLNNLIKNRKELINHGVTV